MRNLALRGLSYASVLAIAAAACSPPPAPTNGGRQHDGRRCLPDMNTEWGNDGLHNNIKAPPCPYTVKTAGTSVRFAFVISVLYGNIKPTAGVTTNIYNSAHNIVGGASIAAFTLNSNDDTIYSSPAGTFTGSTKAAGGVIQDTAVLEVDGTNDGQPALATVSLPGDISTGASEVVGNPQVQVGTATWRAMPAWDTLMYNYSWTVDGSAIGTQATFSHAFPLAGTHTIKTIDIMTSGQADTTIFTAGIAPSSSISGPSQIQNPGTYTWTASTSGCNTTCTYQWQELPEVTGGTWGNTTGTTTHSQSITTTSPSFQLRVITTSQAQSSTSGTWDVNNLSGGTGCNPNCAKKMPSRTIQVKR